MKRLVVGIDIGGTYTKYGFVSESGTVITSKKIPTESQNSFDLYAKNLWKQIEDDFVLIKNDYKLVAIGVGAPNANSRSGCIEFPPNLDWQKVNIVKILSNISQLPVSLENDANVAALGEKNFGKAQALSDFVSITLGTGVGSGAFINHALFLGAHGIGAEAGHLTIIPGGRKCSCGGFGHLEAYASVGGIQQSFFETTGEKLDFLSISERYQAGNEAAEKVIENTAYFLAHGLAGLNCVLAPQAFIISGGVSCLGERFRQQIELEYAKLVYSPFKKFSQILISDISQEYGAILGAASLVI